MAKISSRWRGHDIYFKDDRWFYLNTSTPVADSECPCGHCGAKVTENGHDGCIGKLPSVMNACCGHGVTSDAYVQFRDSTRIAGSEAVAWIEQTNLTNFI